jgi:hypothetical protein
VLLAYEHHIGRREIYRSQTIFFFFKQRDVSTVSFLYNIGVPERPRAFNDLESNLSEFFLPPAERVIAEFFVHLTFPIIHVRHLAYEFIRVLHGKNDIILATEVLFAKCNATRFKILGELKKSCMR